MRAGVHLIGVFLFLLFSLFHKTSFFFFPLSLSLLVSSTREALKGDPTCLLSYSFTGSALRCPRLSTTLPYPLFFFSPSLSLHLKSGVFPVSSSPFFFLVIVVGNHVLSSSVPAATAGVSGVVQIGNLRGFCHCLARTTIYGANISTEKLTFLDVYSAVDVHGDKGFHSNNKAAFALYTNETLDASESISINAVLLDLQDSNISIGLFPADATEECQNNRVGSAGLPGSVACTIGNRRARILCNGTEWSDVSCDSNTPVLVKATVTKGIVTFFVDGDEVECPQLAMNPLQGKLRVGVSTETGQQRGALVEKEGPPGIREALACFSGKGSGAGGGDGGLAAMLRALQGGGGGDDSESEDSDSSDESDSDTPEVGPLYTNAADLKFEIEQDGPIVALTPTVLRCNAAEDGTAYVAVPIDTEERAAIGISVRFTGLNKGYAGCGFFKKEALDAGDAQQYILGKTKHSIGCLLKNGEVFVFINDKPVFCGATPESDELTMHFSFDRKKGMHVRIEKGVVNCDEFKDLSIFDGDLYFGVSLSEEGQLARILPSGLGAPRFHYGMLSMDVDEDKLMRCKHSVRASLSAHERWYGDAEKVFVMRITNVCREPIGIGLVSAKLWSNGRRSMVGSTEFGPYSIGLVVKDRRIYIHHQDEFMEWKPLGRMPPIPNSVDLMMRVSGGKVSFFYQGVPVIMPVVSDLTLPADERFRAAYTMSDKGETAVIPPNVPVRAAQDLTQRYSLVGDAAHVELADAARKATALVPGALCFSSEAFAITPDAWGLCCTVCACNGPGADVQWRGTLWVCGKCEYSDNLFLCDACYWNQYACWHVHPRSDFIPVFGAGFNEVRLTLEDAKDSYLEVGVAPAGYKAGLGTFGRSTTVLLGNVSDLVRAAAMPAEKIAMACPALKNGDEVWIRLAGAEMSVLVNRSTVFKTTLSTEDSAFLNQPLCFGIRMGNAGQRIRVHQTPLFSPREGDKVSVPADAVWLQREFDAAKVPAADRAAAGTTGKLVAVETLDEMVTIDVDGAHKKCPLSCALENGTRRLDFSDILGCK